MAFQSNFDDWNAMTWHSSQTLTTHSASNLDDWNAMTQHSSQTFTKHSPFSQTWTTGILCHAIPVKTCQRIQNLDKLGRLECYDMAFQSTLTTGMLGHGIPVKL